MKGGVKTGIPTIRAVILEYLRKQNEPINWKALEEVVRSERPDLASKDLGATIRSVLQRAPGISRANPGLYSLDAK